MGGLRRLGYVVVALTAACSVPNTTREREEDLPPACGDGTTDEDEVCDDGNTLDGDGCNATCTSDESCGNGVVDPMELCDDGNAVGGDACSADCLSDESCGNGVIDLGVGETCDDANSIPGDGCSANCQSNEQCGNGVTDPNEQCDVLNNVATASCDPNCTFAVCGDGTRNAAANEECDDSNTSNSDACVGCRNARCGDGFLRANVEQCDDGNTNNGDGCNANCAFEPKSYIIPIGSLTNQTFDCSDGTNPYDGCTNVPIGFTWQDSAPFQPAAVQVEINRGINCNGTQTKGTQLNGVFSGNFVVEDPGACICTPPEQVHTFALAAVGSYVRGGANSFTIDASPSCIGFSLEPNWNGYARVTVFP